MTLLNDQSYDYRLGTSESHETPCMLSYAVLKIKLWRSSPASGNHYKVHNRHPVEMPQPSTTRAKKSAQNKVEPFKPIGLIRGRQQAGKEIFGLRTQRLKQAGTEKDEGCDDDAEDGDAREDVFVSKPGQNYSPTRCSIAFTTSVHGSGRRVRQGGGDGSEGGTQAGTVGGSEEDIIWGKWCCSNTSLPSSRPPLPSEIQLPPSSCHYFSNQSLIPLYVRVGEPCPTYTMADINLAFVLDAGQACSSRPENSRGEGGGQSMQLLPALGHGLPQQQPGVNARGLIEPG
ncbi:hypothetical protein ElyMa_000926600 [Elysia marginata]|uniref:Uncharacterized protein n=1 Tax=Elysia marginata TaxID=1093978 RepID=A0AAV4H9X1_9GAST|nr:hypothetical protein ElyMa_000926600 [Elysia marginata]